MSAPKPIYHAPVPPSFEVPNEGRAVFVDFLTANYKLTYDVTQKRAFAASEIVFEMTEEGLPVFDLIDAPSEILVDGTPAAQIEMIPPQGEYADEQLPPLRVILRALKPGRHTLAIKHELLKWGPDFYAGEVSSGFFMSDLADRHFLEAYLPANLEFDQVAMTFEIEVTGATKPHEIFTNGGLSPLGEHRWKITFPDFYNCASIYFHLRSVEDSAQVRYEIASLAGTLPVTIYVNRVFASKLPEFQKSLAEILPRLEAKLGPFPHDGITIYAGMFGGGMEYAGATATDLDVLEHELAHSFFARGVMPTSGNAGWIDEAMATYVGGPYPTNADDVYPARLTNHSPYLRRTDTDAYSTGANLLARLDRDFRERATGLSMAGFLMEWSRDFRYKTVTTKAFQNSLEKYSGGSLEDLFNVVVYGQNGWRNDRSVKGPHLRLTPEKFREMQ